LTAASGASAGPNSRPGTTTKPVKAQMCSTIMVPKWDCKNGDQPGDVFTKGNTCKLILVPQTVCPQQ
jgi:hypothetical protein